MNPFEHLNEELKKAKQRNTVLIASLSAMLFLVIFLFVMIQRKNQRLEEVSSILEMKNNLIASQEDLLAALDSVDIDDEKMGKAIKLFKDFVQEETPIATANASVKPTKTKAVTKTVARLTSLESLVIDLFSASEEVRAAARNKLLRSYKSDPQLVPTLLRESADKITFDNKESIWQVIYIFDQLPADQLEPSKNDLLDFFKACDEIAILGTKTRPKVNAMLQSVGLQGL